MKVRSLARLAGLALILFGIGALVYPTVSDRWNQLHATKLIETYQTTVSELSDDKYAELWQVAEDYNKALAANPARFEVTDESHEEYLSLLDVTGTGIMCYLEMPSISVKLPVYHTTEESVLQIAAGHLEGTSLPVGGIGTHSAFSGHTGLTSAKLFTALEHMQIGDQFLVHVLGQTLLYQVDQIDVVLPEETELLRIDPEQDYCTLITCTPYGVNSHRLLVRGVRTELPDDQQEEAVVSEIEEDVRAIEFEMMLWVVIPAVLIGGILIFVVIRKRKERP